MNNPKAHTLAVELRKMVDDYYISHPEEKAACFKIHISECLVMSVGPDLFFSFKGSIFKILEDFDFPVAQSIYRLVKEKYS